MLDISRITRGKRQCSADTDWMDMFEMETAADGILIVRPVSAVLTVDSLQKLVRHLDRVSAGVLKRIHFDLSNVTELAGPWGVHFAILIEFSSRRGIRVSAGGLKGQPLALAWLFRNTAELVELLARVGGGKANDNRQVRGMQVA